MPTNKTIRCRSFIINPHVFQETMLPDIGDMVDLLAQRWTGGRIEYWCVEAGTAEASKSLVSGGVPDGQGVVTRVLRDRTVVVRRSNVLPVPPDD